MKKDFKAEIAKLVSDSEEMVDADEIESIIETPNDDANGDYALPCFTLAKKFRKSPNLIAEDLAEKLFKADFIEKIEPVSGYLNFYLKKESFIKDTLDEVISKLSEYGHLSSNDKTVVVEFSSPNIAKPFHIGHIRSTLIGNALANISKALGYNTVRVNHIGDYGTQFGKIISAYKRWGNEEDVNREPVKTLLSYYTRFHAEAETDETLEEEARMHFKNLEEGREEETKLWKWFRDVSLKEFGKVYDLLGIKFDSFDGESFYTDKMPAVIDEMESMNLLEKSRGATIVNLQKYNMTDVLVKKSDGSSLYITRDIAAAIYRHEKYNFYKNIYVVGAQQDLHFKQLVKILELMNKPFAKDCVHVPFGMVSIEGGTLSTRNGTVVFLEDVLSKAIEKTLVTLEDRNFSSDKRQEVARQVGVGAVVFQELYNTRIKDYQFSWDRALSFDGETGPYVQYTCARANSVLSKASDEGIAIKDIEDVDISYITNKSAYALVRLIFNFSDKLTEAFERYEPSIVARYAMDVCKAFNRFYHDEHILTDNEGERDAKLLLVKASVILLKNVLKILGMESPDKM